MQSALKPLSMIYNEKSGFHASHHDEIYEQLMTLWTSYGFEFQVFDIKAVRDIQSLMKKVFQRHEKYQHQGVIVAAGGDGRGSRQGRAAGGAVVGGGLGATERLGVASRNRTSKLRLRSQ